eukprot:171177-Amorphochlora_amoeboformis.AAC.1
MRNIPLSGRPEAPWLEWRPDGQGDGLWRQLQRPGAKIQFISLFARSLLFEEEVDPKRIPADSPLYLGSALTFSNTIAADLVYRRCRRNVGNFKSFLILRVRNGM